jgi:hypothetical protein
MAEFQRPLTMEIDFPADGQVTVDAVDGSVVVEGWDREAVSFVATKTITAADEATAERLAEDLSCEFRRSEDKLTIELGRGQARYGARGRVDAYVRIPAHSNLYVDTSAGNVDVVRVNGTLRLDTGAGTVTVQQCGGNIVVDTSSGGLVAENIDGDLHVDVGSGSVNINGVTGSCFVDSGSSPVSVRNVAGRTTIDAGNRATVSDISGELTIDAGSSVEVIRCGASVARIDAGSRVDAELLVVPGGTYTIEAGNEARIKVPANAGVDLDIDAAAFKYELPLQITELSDDHLSATLNGGGATLQVEAGARFTLTPTDAPIAESVRAAVSAAEQADQGRAAAGADADAASPGTSAAPEVPLAPDAATIIRLVAERKITPEEADRLLNALEP